MPVVPSPALEQCLELLRCPVCQTRGLCTEDDALLCSSGHTFDIARHGYASLLTGARATSGDDADMARARNRFLSSGSYAPLRDTVARLASPAASERARIVDAGCGTGYYLAGVLDRLPGARGLGLDTSAHALRTAARVHDRAAAVAWDIFRPFPLVDRVADVVLNVFAPRNPEEFHRVLRPTARLIVVRPTGRHLTELRRRLPAILSIDPAKEQRLQQALDPWFAAVHAVEVEYSATLAEGEAKDLVAMSPSARHLKCGELDDSSVLPDRVTVSVLATAYQPR